MTPATQKERGGLDKLAAEIREVNAANGWKITKPEDWDLDYKITAVLGLVVTEVAEAIEAHREDDRENFLVELADIVIRTLDAAGGFADDFESIVRAKIKKNRGRGHKHGGKRI